ncbi:MAG: hypothetical protein A3H69_00570 [Candidatus Sungbacteria bacterium RIFCSPLOWO2_02_FULL_47_9]|uniref:Response regulatory domain-containing protein n=1 Tax=Candidatus Sungbacteria bacterium RIFCSPHIGHO2_01_FULL_47_32 TaxID=1802264 RepID=A0A1G2K202_9BACT|nr:MAG: Plastid ompR-like protein [Parcubacteria group bacterium GW2011_GWA2_47_10]OGZ93436.1 MAG: hypothetical protein A2633_01790 [Candidatus Sungbacteria bacterium RIFCSPHIGHO2_01_FULL_47_32]OGZ99815.1 MAG: hypothetical protein A3D57_01130 [Candidatus Sungbacteria bacterium RIFCSPHIGHO2_02_FULL_46_12]OHA05030.1 MAG: hypothetical protein A3A28_03795 [Candidatus Sungbacteria bacterium RIFCSPLOWO2_01_FULL_47_32]OHA11856.1 MAG: hypothetical protein A3H69_00570 [Candidatus Sungbacteria bacterium 
MLNKFLNKFNKKILVIEDDPSLRQAITDKLTGSGFSVVQAEDGEEGLRFAYKNHPRVILLDLMLPITDGAGVLDELRKDEWGKDVPVIVMSNLLEDENLVKRYHVFGYIVKSDWKMEDVIKKVREAIAEG